MTSPTRHASTALPASTPHSAPPQPPRVPAAFHPVQNPPNNNPNRIERNSTESSKGKSGRSDGAWTRGVMQEYVKGSKNDGATAGKSAEDRSSRTNAVETARRRTIPSNANLPPRPRSSLFSANPAGNPNYSRANPNTQSQATTSSSSGAQAPIARIKVNPNSKRAKTKTAQPPNPATTALPIASASTSASTASSTAVDATPTKKPRNRTKKVASQLMDASERAERTLVEDDASSAGSVDDVAIFHAMLESRRPSDVTIDNLNSQILRLYETKKASPAAITARKRLIERLEDLFNEQRWFWGESHGRHNYRTNPIRIEAFGSIRFGLATDTSDLDLVLLDPFRPNGFDDFDATDFDALPEVYNTRSIATRLERAGCMNVLAIPSAGVPIVKFEAIIDKERIHVDINTNERMGLFNSKLLAAYCELSPVVRPLCVFVKFWAKQRRLNDPSGASGLTSFSSYTLVLLTISYLQSLNILPNLQDPALIAELNIERRQFFTRPKKASGRKSRKVIYASGGIGWDITFVYADEYLAAGKGKEKALPTVGELARGFFNHYANLFEMDKEVVSISSGGVFARNSRSASPRPASPSDAHIDKISLTDDRHDTEEEHQQSPEEIRRQKDEDEALQAMAEEDGRAPATPMINDAVISTVLPGSIDFVQPIIWTQQLIVQDPFILTRNTALNVTDSIVETFVGEMKRAIQLIDDGATIPEICASISNEAAFQAMADVRRAERNRRRKGKPAVKAPVPVVVTKTVVPVAKFDESYTPEPALPTESVEDKKESI